MAWNRQVGTQVSAQKVAQLAPCSSGKVCPSPVSLTSIRDLQIRDERRIGAQIACKDSYLHDGTVPERRGPLHRGSELRLNYHETREQVVVDTSVSSLVKWDSLHLLYWILVRAHSDTVHEGRPCSCSIVLHSQEPS